MRRLMLIFLLLAVPAQGDYGVQIIEETVGFWPVTYQMWRVRVTEGGELISQRLFMPRVRVARAMKGPDVCVVGTDDGLWRWGLPSGTVTRVPGTEGQDCQMLELCGVFGMPFAAYGENTHTGDPKWVMRVINVASGLWVGGPWFSPDPYFLGILPGSVWWYDHEIFLVEHLWIPLPV